MRATKLKQEDDATREAVAEVVKSGEKLVMDRLTLLQHDVTDELRKFGVRVAQGALSVLFALSAWIAISIGLGLALAELMPAYLAALTLGLTYGATALGLVLRAKRHTAQRTQAT